MRLALVLLASLGQHGVAQDATLVSADHPRADVRLLDGSGCERHLLIGRESRLSGHGKLWEYYHFLIDFALRVVYALRNCTCARAVVHAPGWYNDERFSLRLSRTPRSMVPLFNTLFGRYRLRLEPYGLRETPTGELLNFDPHFRWSEQPREWLAFFRDFVRALAAPIPPMGERFDVLVVRRGTAAPNAPKCTRKARLFAQSPVIIAMHGAGISNLAFATSGAAVIEVGLRANRCYMKLAERMGVHYFSYRLVGHGFDRGMQKLSLKALAKTIEVLLGLGGGALLARVPCMLAPAVPVCERHQPSIGPYPSLSRIVRLECHVR
ncbi:hypothetical protein KFE25_002964 [Diacronema lutheri]|uniref:Uncharacterized protein n=1 Tax=Diacronema lutheri TaxID=2081491 RepID=A0A8J5XJS6_DIALT|nr:hypothetical protein KFE25_002964 [Diacronema lutheri]